MARVVRYVGFFAAGAALAASVLEGTQVRTKPVVDPRSVYGGARFVEEAIRPKWDRGCEDWPADAEPVRVDIAKTGGDLRVRSRLVLRPEPGESIEALTVSVEKFLSDERLYAAWVLPGINEKPTGGRYFVTLEDLKGTFESDTRHRELRGDYNFKVLWLERVGTTSLLFRVDRASPPVCPAFAEGLAVNGERQGKRILYRMVPRPEILERLVGEIWLVPFANRVELWLRLVARPSKLVYELMPESLARAELQSRGRRLWENFVDVRRLAVVSAAAKPASANPSPSVVPPKKVR